MARKPIIEQQPWLPPRPFLYALDQIAALLNIEEEQLRRHYIFFERRSTGIRYPDLIRAVNVAPEVARVKWRVTENELKRWMQYKGFRYMERDWIV